MTMFLFLRAAAVATAMLLAMPAGAGQQCETGRLSVRAVEHGLALAELTMKTLDASGHQVVLLARAGQDLRKYGVHYSHLGLAYRQPDGRGGHAWRVLHKLNHCGSADSALYRQGLGQFFLDDLWRHEAAYAAPTADMQARLLALLQDDLRALRLHHAPYSIVSYAWGQRYQQSNQWLIETIASAMGPATSRVQAQAWLQLYDYRPASLRIDALTRLGGRVSAANVAFDDHPASQRFAGRIETVTADSVFTWLERSGLGTAAVAIGQ